MFEFIKYFMFLSVAISSAAYGNTKINLNELPFNSEVVKLISFEKSILSNIPYSQLRKIGTPKRFLSCLTFET